ncbi:MAG: GIY-YIG nuclease family protein [Oscillospiraceae bacterium]|nr:GIY-YIG nuclease family protein [Oscillospiraceae bacterium]
MGYNKTIQMCIFDGNPNGRIMCELSNWNGRIYKITRNELAAFSEREDSENTGVYFLYGRDEQNNETVYIGEAERIHKRLKNHLKDEYYWNDCIVIISKDDHLNKAHVKYLENKFYMLAQQSGRSVIINTTIPTCSSVSEYDEGMLEEFFSNACLLVNTLGYKTFELPENSTIKHQNDNLFFYITASRGANAKGIVVADGFTVMKDSKIADKTVPSMTKSLFNIRQNLLDEHIIDENYMFTKDYVFASPSTAASVVMGKNANGRKEWKTSDKKTIKEIEENSEN